MEYYRQIRGFETEPNSITVNTLATDPVGPGQMSFTDATNLANAYGGNQSIGIDPSIITESNGTLSVGNVFSITAPITVNEGGSDTVTFSSASPVSVYDWSIALTDENGGALATQTVNGTSGNYVYSGAESLQINATVTAIVHASNSSISYLFPAVGAAVVPTAPDGLGVTFSSSTEIDFSWTDHSTIAVGDIIYESTDGGNTFYPIDEVNPVAAGSTNTYQATGLNSGSGYQFYITADGGYAESLPCTSITSSTTFVQPALDVEGTGTVVEGQPYELDLTAEYPDGEPGAVQYWAINWNDGLGNSTSDIIDYYYPSGADPTQPLVVTHAFNSGISMPDVSVTAVDAVNGSFDGGLQAVTVTPIAPTLGLVSASGSTLTVNWSNSSSISTGTVVLLSTDGTNYFVADSVGAGITSDTISDLNLNTQYSVEVQTNSVNGVSDASNIEQVGTPDAAAPSIVVTPTNMPNVGESYNLTLSATYADNTPQAEFIAYFLVDWGDGQGQIQYTPSTPGDLVTISSPSYSCTTTSATATITAVATNGNTVTTTFPMYFAPPAPTNVTSVLEPNSTTSATITWSGDDSISSTYVVQVLAPGSTTWVTLGTVDSSDETSPGSDEYSIADPDSGSGYLYSVTNTAPGAASGASSAAPGAAGVSSSVESAIIDPTPTAYSDPVYNNGVCEAGVTGSWSADGPYLSGQSVTFTVNNLPTHISFDVLIYGSETPTLSGSGEDGDLMTMTGPGDMVPQETVPTPDWVMEGRVQDLNGQSSASFTVTGNLNLDDNSNRVWDITSTQVVVHTGSIDIGDDAVPVGGEVDIPVHYAAADISDGTTPGGASDIVLSVKSFDSNVVQPMNGTVELDANGDGTLVVRGVGFGNAHITLEDVIGDQSTDTVGVVAPEVISTGSETQGATYTANDMPGFTFSLGAVSLTPVTVDYNTLGSTLPSSLLGNLLAGSVTIDAGEMSTFVPFTVPDDGKIAPTRVAVVNLVVPGDTQPASTQMAVLNTDVPTIKMNGATDHAVIQLDPQADNGKLTKISMSANIAPGAILISTTLIWSPGQFTMWLTDKIGLPGDDLGSLPNAHFYVQSGLETYTWQGKAPAAVYGQDLSGSSNWDTTFVTLSVDVAVAATPVVPMFTASPSNTSHGTANGPEIYWNNRAVTGVFAGDMLIGQGTNLVVAWLGPEPITNGPDAAYWNVPGGVGGYSDSGSSSQLLPVDPLTFDNSLHFYWGPQGQNGGAVGETVSCDGIIDGNNFSLNTHFDIWTPSWSLANTGVGSPTITGFVIQATGAGGPDANPIYNEGILYHATVDASSMPADIQLANSKWFFLQLITPDRIWTTPSHQYSLFQTGVQGLDTSTYYGFEGKPPSMTTATLGQSEIFSDAPKAAMNDTSSTGDPISAVSLEVGDQFRFYMMFNAGGDSIDVPLAWASWQWNFVVKAPVEPEFVGPHKIKPGQISATSQFPKWTYVVNSTNIVKGH